ncbi:MAG: 16S rRNA (uracil(1498)-N(3))-methyltransferase [Alphaproteobacteria bacterium]|jgi:16S rRNA (uracil1498-N3)-methyltransferase|nr:16S rRNA (uracil(1498)-N(3))-methyltransferase [Alphaproteobacteria bacterium]MBT5390429.1 16S rRNA (uracil(1498)-N(3))-methyltransferase [Alphaproteobacteria bacterium]MBT5540728.1 16S rRNA (uracil(1498)-N(3))-methyltransferase [Alphaproteobacteria bacterium]MBT5654393.1 16S rRNA (uracil(1498)-N(3))-methyltransferase [Alphaproteobacteria bacterium]
MSLFHTLARLYTPEDLSSQTNIPLSSQQAHYLCHVLRLKSGDPVRLFNGRDGEFLAKLKLTTKKSPHLDVENRLHPQSPEKGPALVFAPIKNDRMGWMMEKATELGVQELFPVITERTTTRNFNRKRLEARIIEAAEQCERLTIPTLHDSLPLHDFLATWSKDIPILWAVERTKAPTFVEELKRQPTAMTFLVGPEGGFSNSEKEILKETSFMNPVTLGAKILRTETAALSGLTLLQMAE